MKVIFRFQDVNEIANDEVSILDENADGVQKAAHKDQRNKYGKCMFLKNSCGESINDLQKIEKVLRSLIANFDYIVVSIEESKNLVEMKLEELQASLDAHGMRLKQRNFEREKVDKQTLQARFIKKFGKGNVK
ncbi:hypothetical protein KIW84_052232 [Lathyrus oleraceus]|uniref:Gag-pol polyprotein n=1 Tax=Pisum sativum TaxID=3888 RepID=A0A9D4WR61_PEA|nr:hypothetical protein KIW84_052232 [Pisum sativum]